MIDTATAIEASATWARIARAIPILEAALEPGRTGENATRRPPASKPPMSVWIHDLLFELERDVDFYVSALLMETHDIKRAPHDLAGKIALIAQRHGHFTADADRKIALDFTDTAEGHWTKIERILRQPLPDAFMGPCLEACGGDLWLKHGRIAATCDGCGSDADLGVIREHLLRALEARLMERKEIAPALRILGAKTTRGTVDSWIARHRLVPVLPSPQMFRFSDAVELAQLAMPAA